MGSTTSRTDVCSDGVDFIRFCYTRRKVGWPEIYDEMCAVAARGLFRGWSHEELATHGIAFSLPGLPALAAVVRSTIETEPTLRNAASRGRRDGVADVSAGSSAAGGAFLAPSTVTSTDAIAATAATATGAVTEDFDIPILAVTVPGFEAVDLVTAVEAIATTSAPDPFSDRFVPEATVTV